MNQETIAEFFAEEDDRLDGIEKVTGRAKFTADFKPENMAYGVFVTSSIARGAIRNLNTAAAKNAPGVLEVISYRNCPPIPGYKPWAKNPAKKGFEWPGLKIFNDNLVHYYGQPIALVVASSWEKALQAARLVKADYVQEAAETDFDRYRRDESKLKLVRNYARGIQEAMSQAEVSVEGEYYIPNETHNPIELHVTIAQWEGEDKLTVYDKSQGPKGTQFLLAQNFGLEEKNVRVITKFVGGAFGASLRSWPHVPAACIAAKMVNRPVRVQLTRRQMFTICRVSSHLYRLTVGTGGNWPGAGAPPGPCGAEEYRQYPQVMLLYISISSESSPLSGSSTRGWPILSEASRNARGTPRMVSPFNPSAPTSLNKRAVASQFGISYSCVP